MAAKSITPSLEVEKLSSNELKKKVEAYRKKTGTIENTNVQVEEEQQPIQTEMTTRLIT